MAREKPGARQAAEPLPLPVTLTIPTPRREEREDVPFALAPDADALGRIARFLDVNGVEALSFEGAVRAAQDGRDVVGRVRGRVLQTCVVTLEPVTTGIDAEVLRRLRTDIEAPEGAEIELDGEAENAPEPLGATIDLGQIMIETLALSIDPWPRAPGAEHGARVYGPPGAEPLTDEAARPFADLATLRERLGRKE